MRNLKIMFIAVVLMLGFSISNLYAEEKKTSGYASVDVMKIDTGDTAWMIVATAFVMLMTLPGLALFYGGLAKRKDTLNTMAMSFVTYCIASFLWVIYGFSLSFGTDIGGIIGNTEKLFFLVLV